MAESRISAKSGTTPRNYIDKYDLQSFTYPENLFSSKEEFGNTWMMINVNVLEQSKYFSEDTTVALDPQEQGRRWTEADARGQTVGQATGALATSGAVVGGVTAFIAGGDAVSVGQGATRGAVGGGAAAIPIMAAGTAQRTTKRLKAAIQLPMPGNIITPYNAEWGADDTKLFDLAMRAPGMGLDILRDGARVVTGDFESIQKSGASVADAATSMALSINSTFGNAGVSAAAGLASNPKKEMFFQGVDFRNFSFDYRFYPKNEKESLYIKRIVDLLKFHMYPEYRSKDRFTFIYPSEFDITFFKQDGKENPWVNKIATCALVGMTVNYTPTGMWATHYDGSPVMINLSMTFKELSILTKENLSNPVGNSEVESSY